MRTKESIQIKWEKKLEEMRVKADYRFSILFKNKVAVANKKLEYEQEKMERKKRSYIKKKEEEYRRKMMNEIREIEGKPKRVYKSEGPKIKPLEFAMAIAQENARLRDSDVDGNGNCISCGRYCSWGEHAGGHRYSRRFKTCCLEEENINLQCHNCNWITGPKGNPVEKTKVNNEYDRRLEIKFGEGTVAGLSGKVHDYFQGKARKYNLKQKIPYLIRVNEELWAKKNFYAPRKKWRQIWEEYDKRH